MLKLADKFLGQYPVFLAPMEDVTDLSFRLICKKFGADVVITEFVSSEALVREVEKTMVKMRILETERPVGIQIYGHIIENMARAAKIVEQYKPDFIDINYGCPVKKIALRGAGAGMLRDLDKMEAMTRAVVEAVSLPVTVKTRLGWDEDSIVIEQVVKRLQNTGIQAITIHARTRSQMYGGKADWSWIYKLTHDPQVKLPIIGNGDIFTPQQAKKAFEYYGVDGIMIGRGAIGRPWIFAQVKHYLQNGTLLPEPTVSERVEIAKEHFQLSLKYKGLKRGIFEMRRHFVIYFKNLPNFKEFKLKLVTSTDPDEIFGLLDKIAANYGDFRPEPAYAYEQMQADT